MNKLLLYAFGDGSCICLDEYVRQWGLFRWTCSLVLLLNMAGHMWSHGCVWSAVDSVLCNRMSMAEQMGTLW